MQMLMFNALILFPITVIYSANKMDLKRLWSERENVHARLTFTARGSTLDVIIWRL